MSKRIRQVILVSLCVIMLLFLCACDSGSVNTEMIVNADFSGSRTMSIEIKQSDLSTLDVLGLFTPQPSEFVDILEDNCPDELQMTTAYSGKDATCTFTLEYTSMDDYTAKITSLLGRRPTIVFEGPSGELFESGVTLMENFSSSELFGWAEDALAAEYPNYADKIDFSGNDGATVVIFEGVSRETTAKINVEPVSAKLDRVVVSTTRYGDNDYARTFTFSISANDVALIGREKLTQQLFAPMTVGIGKYVTAGWNSDYTAYTVTMKQGSLEELVLVTATVLPGSTTGYVSNTSVSAFAESGTLSETLSFEGLRCNNNGSADVTLEYSAGDDTVFSGDDLYSGAMLSNNGKTLTLKAERVTQQGIDVVSETRYSVESIAVATDLSLTGSLEVSVSLTFPEKSSRSASERAAAILSQQYADTGLSVRTQQVGGSTSVVSVADGLPEVSSDAVYALMIIAKGTPEEVSQSFAAAFGEGNSIDIDSGKTALSLYSDSAVEHSINLTTLTDMAGYAGNIAYSFSSSMTRISDAGWSDATGKYREVVLGENRRNNFAETDIISPAFTISYRYSRFNLIFVLTAAVLAIIALWGIMMLLSFAARKLYHGSVKRRESLTYEAVKTVALANVPEDQQGDIAELPRELTQRPTVVLEPRSDDGLNEDDDEPEGMVLFASTLRILLIAVSVLFFFPFCNLQRTGNILDSNATLSGWNLFYGKTIFGVDFEPYRVVIIMLAIPLLMLVLLAARRVLPRLLLPLAVSAGSVFQIYYMMQLPDLLESRLDVLGSQISGYVTNPNFQWGYTYSIVIYALVAIGGLMLMFGDIAYLLDQRRKKG